MYKFLPIILALFLSFNVSANADKDRAEIKETREKILKRLYKEQPEVKAKIAKAAGYATFSNIGVNVVFLSAGYGSGVVKNNKTGKETYMKMASGGVGIGFGVKDFNAVFVFKNSDALNSFIESGWDFSGQADAAAKSGKKGGEASEAATAVSGVDIYQMTENGLALQATLQGTKYWKDEDLN